MPAGKRHYSRSASCGRTIRRFRRRSSGQFPAAVVMAVLLVISAAASAGAGPFQSERIEELSRLNFSGRAVESFERVGRLITEEPDNYAAYLLRANCYGWFIARNPGNRMYDDPLLESLEACIDRADDVEEDSPEYGRALYYRALAEVLKARFRAVRGYDISARWATRGAKDLADRLVEEFPDNIDARLPRAIFNATWGDSPLWQRIALFTLTVPRGNRERGIETLEEIAERGEDSRLWALIVLLDIYMMEEATAQQYLETAERLHNLFPDNSVIELELGDSYRRLERWVLAEAVYQSILAKVRGRVRSYDEVVYEISRLREVECQVNLEKMDEAFENVREILISNPINPEWIVPWAHFYSGRIYAHRGELVRADRALQYALDGQDYDGLHQAAERERDRVRKLMEEGEDNE